MSAAAAASPKVYPQGNEFLAQMRAALFPTSGVKPESLPAFEIKSNEDSALISEGIAYLQWYAGKRERRGMDWVFSVGPPADIYQMMCEDAKKPFIPIRLYRKRFNEELTDDQAGYLMDFLRFIEKAAGLLERLEIIPPDHGFVDLFTACSYLQTRREYQQVQGTREAARLFCESSAEIRRYLTLTAKPKAKKPPRANPVVRNEQLVTARRAKKRTEEQQRVAGYHRRRRGPIRIKA